MNVMVLRAQIERLSRILGVVYGEDHSRGTQKVYPTEAAGVAVPSAGAPWTLGAYTEIVPVNTVTGKFTIVGVNVEVVAVAGDVKELILYSGLAGSEVEIGRTRFAGTGFYRIPVVLLDANSRIIAKLGDTNAGAQNSTISISYNEG